jgi:hypothetical protein
MRRTAVTLLGMPSRVPHVGQVRSAVMLRHTTLAICPEAHLSCLHTPEMKQKYEVCGHGPRLTE